MKLWIEYSGIAKRRDEVFTVWEIELFDALRPLATPVPE
jgi:hypothetical protein